MSLDMAPGRKSCRKNDRPWSGERSCPSVASYLEFYANIPDYTDLHDLSNDEFYQRLQALKAAQKQFSQNEIGCNERPSSQSSFGSKMTEGTTIRPGSESRMDKEKLKLPPRVVVHTPDDACDEQDDANLYSHHHHHHHHREVCRSMGALSLESSVLHIHGEPCLRSHSRASTRPTKIERKHEVPLLSRIPLFDKIMAEQEERRRIIHERNAQELRALVQPFSFTKKEEAVKRMRGSCQVHCEERPRRHSRAPFRAKPVPRDLFSDRAYDRMHEDQFYRAVKKRIRAEEMLKIAKMPPSMEAREKVTKKGKSKSLDYLDGKTMCQPRSHSRGGLEVSWPRRSLAPGRRNQTRPSSCTDSSVDASPNESILGPRRRPRPASTLSAARSNLASVLRSQTARNRLEKLMKVQIEEQEERAQARLKARLLRLSPVWRTLDYSTDEDVALRLAQRRQEARLQGQNHRRLMEAIHGRVHNIPPLFQDPGRIKCGNGKYLKKNSGRSKSLENNLDANNRNSNNSSRKSKSFYVDRSEDQKSEICQPKSDSKEESSASDAECHNYRMCYPYD